MRTWTLIGMLILAACSGCSSKPRLDRTDVVGESAEGTVFAETWYGAGLIELPIWKVSLRPKGSTNAEILFTVESVWQESDPGFPRFVATNGIEVICDAGESYVFAISSRSFITNFYSGDVYAGDFVPREKRIEPDGAANGSQPFSSDTNRTSSAAGSRR